MNRGELRAYRFLSSGTIVSETPAHRVVVFMTTDPPALSRKARKGKRARATKWPYY
jgi:hypothetical protein